ncbi:hypothetical protein [Nocardiopsis alba]|uniref:hypothetical protein n=1 Tax=Nocardiopsis alba TaxID=53437 RepID=UPI0033C4C740
MARKPPPPTITPALLDRGWSAPAGCRIRLARPTDADAVRALQHVADGRVSPDQEYADTLAAGQLGHLIIPALTAREPSRALLEQVTQHAQAGAWNALGDGVSFTLVAENRRGDVVGALLASFPGTLFGLLLPKPRRAAK